MINLDTTTPCIYLGEYDIHVNKYLSYAQIQQIVDTLEQLAKEKSIIGRPCDYWAARQQHIDMMVLAQATDIPEETLKEKSIHTVFQNNGIIDAVKANIINYNQLEEAIQYTEKWDKTLTKIVNSFTTLLEKNKYDIHNISHYLKEITNGEQSAK